VDTLYKKPFDALTEEEKSILQASRSVLASGDRLYGLSPDDTTHIEYAIGLALHELGGIETKSQILTAVEFGKDVSGFFIAFIPAK
jgi:hypothetical protein